MSDATVSIAYLAPEIPGPSSTFVYNEIFSLENYQQLNVESFSVHRPRLADNVLPNVASLADKTIYLYEQKIHQIIVANFRCLLVSPIGYLKSLCVCLSDMARCFRSPKLCLGLFYRFLIAMTFAPMLKAKDIKHVHIHFAHVPTDIGMYAAIAIGISYSVTAHANDIFERGWLVKEKVARSAFFATISEFNIRWLTTLGVDANKLTVVRCGVDSHLFSPREVKPKSRPVVFGFLGRLVEKKGVAVSYTHLTLPTTPYV